MLRQQLKYIFVFLYGAAYFWGVSFVITGFNSGDGPSIPIGVASIVIAIVGTICGVLWLLGFIQDIWNKGD